MSNLDFPDDPDDRLARARLSLDGLSVGDGFGQRFFAPEGVIRRWLAERELPEGPWGYTDDTLMALSVVSILRQHGEIDRDRLAESFARRYDPARGYGPAMYRILERIDGGMPWAEAATRQFGGKGSFGNGGAMRVAPLGAYFAEDLGGVIGQARRSAEVTHSHPEGIAGTIAVAIAAAWAWRLRDEPSPNREEFLERVWESVPGGVVRDKIRYAQTLGPDASARQAAFALGSGTQLSAQDTVPFALWCAGGHLRSFEDALWTTVRGLGDRDTTCAIVGGIVAMHNGKGEIPARWLTRRESLPDWPFREPA